MRRVNQAPAAIDGGVFEQPFHRAPTRPGEADLDLLHLLGDMDVDGGASGHRDNGAHLIGGDGAEAVRSDADRRTGYFSNRVAACREEFLEAVEIAEEPPLTVGGGRTAEIAMRIEHREERHSDAGRRGSRQHALRHLGNVGIGRAVDAVMQVVEFADAREARFQHFDIELCCDRLDVVGRDGKCDAVHRLAPGPKIVRPRTAMFREPGHGTLEGVAVEVRHAGNADRMALVAGQRRGAGRDAFDQAVVVDDHTNIVAPAVRRERRPEMQARRQPRIPGRSRPCSRALSIAMS